MRKTVTKIMFVSGDKNYFSIYNYFCDSPGNIALRFSKSCKHMLKNYNAQDIHKCLSIWGLLGKKTCLLGSGFERVGNHFNHPKPV